MLFLVKPRLSYDFNNLPLPPKHFHSPVTSFPCQQADIEHCLFAILCTYYSTAPITPVDEKNAIAHANRPDTLERQLLSAIKLESYRNKNP